MFGLPEYFQIGLGIGAGAVIAAFYIAMMIYFLSLPKADAAGRNAADAASNRADAQR